MTGHLYVLDNLVNSNRFMQWLQNYAVSIAWSLAFLALIANATLLYLNFRGVSNNFEDVLGQYEAMLDLQKLLETMLNAETGHRGYIITGEERYLEPYQAAIPLIDRTYNKIRNHFEGDAEKQGKLAELKEIITKRLMEMKFTLELRRAQGFEPARLRLREDRGKAYMDEFREGISALTSHERNMLEQRRASVAERRLRSFVTFLVGTIVLFCMCIAAFLVVRQQLVYRKIMNAQLTQANETLEQRVEHRTEALRQSNASLLDEINERTRLEEQATRFAQELQRSNKELEQFASVASHDLQEPLRKIQAFSDRLTSRYATQLDTSGKEYIDRIQSSAGRMRRLIEDLLAFSRIATRGRSFVEVNLNKIAQEVVTDLEQRLHETQGKVIIDHLPTIQADERQMQQLLQNLIGNGLKFHRPGTPPVIRVSSRIVAPFGPQMPDQLELSVSDNGIGFDNQYAERIFQVFQRLHGRSEFEGTGMGLAICRKIVERHGGSITASGQPGVGSTFVVTLPLTTIEPSRSL